MKKRVYIAVLILLMVMSLSQVAFARKGVGIVWTTETEIVNEGASHCIGYGIYNPWDEDVTATLSVSDELKGIITKEDTDPKFVPAETYHDQAIPVEFCFKLARVYARDCLIGGMLCEQTCSEPQVEYSGSILAVEEQTGGATGTGSATSLGVSVPLKIKVGCNAHARDYTPVYVVVIIIALLLIGWILYKKQKSNANKQEWQ